MSEARTQVEAFKEKLKQNPKEMAEFRKKANELHIEANVPLVQQVLHDEISLDRVIASHLGVALSDEKDRAVDRAKANAKAWAQSLPDKQ